MRENDPSKYRLFENLTPIDEDVPPGFEWESQVNTFSMSYTAYEPKEEYDEMRERSNSVSTTDDAFGFRAHFLNDKTRSNSFSINRHNLGHYTSYVPPTMGQNSGEGNYVADRGSGEDYNRFMENRDFRRTSSFSVNRQDLDFSITTYRTEDGNYNNGTNFLMPDNERNRSNSFSGQNSPFFDTERDRSNSFNGQGYAYNRSSSLTGQNPPYMASGEERDRSNSFSAQPPPYNKSNSFTGPNTYMTGSEERLRSNSFSGQNPPFTPEERNRSSSFSSQNPYYGDHHGDNFRESSDNSNYGFQYEHQRRYTAPDVREFTIYNPPPLFKPNDYRKKNEYRNTNNSGYQPYVQTSNPHQRRHTAGDIYSPEVTRNNSPKSDHQDTRKFKQRKPHSAYKNKRGRNRSQKDHPEMFEINLDSIITGEDTRSTLMIQNIPNKYDQELMLETLDENFRGTYDFFYLPWDFSNDCNVGYGFINFISEATIPNFHKDFNNSSWPRFKSTKICNLKYGRIQGKEELIEHFKDTRLMKEDPRYRPAIFFSSGDEVGQAQEFPSS